MSGTVLGTDISGRKRINRSLGLGNNRKATNKTKQIYDYKLEKVLRTTMMLLREVISKGIII